MASRSATSLALISSLALLAAACTDGSSGVSTEASNSTSAAPSSDEVAADPTDAPLDTEPPTTDAPTATEPPPATDAPVATEVPADRSTLDWAVCEDAGNAAVVLDCATLPVPLDHADPDGPTIDIAVARAAATGPASDVIGSLVFNPGGPGGSGIESLGFLPLTMSSDITDRFDLVSFDPRGVGASAAVECDTDVDDQITLLDAGDDAGWAELVAENEQQRATCTSDTEALAPYVGTNNAARDMDLLREALGDDGLSYVGYSYGTRLGATYAELFPSNVRALVLDAAVKPTADSAVINLEQGGGFDRALENFAAACDADTDCVLQEFGPTLEVIDALEDEIAELGRFPTDDPDRVLTPGELSLGIVAALYSKQSWPFLASALFTAEAEQDGTLLQVLGDSLVGRQPDGSYDNSTVANGFINCADDPARPNADQQRALADEAASLSTHFGPFLRPSTGCLGVTDSIDPIAIGPAAGAAPIVVIGSTGDPATPFEWSVELADSLESAVLYSVEAEGHTAYGSIDCVQSDIDAYLLDLTVPAVGANCSDNDDADFFLPAGEDEIGQILAFFDCVRENGADLPEIGTADVLADPTLDSILGEIDLTDPAFGAAVVQCQDLVPTGI